MHQLFFPNGFEKTKVRWEKIKIKLAHNIRIDATDNYKIKTDIPTLQHLYYAK